MTCPSRLKRARICLLRCAVSTDFPGQRPLHDIARLYTKTYDCHHETGHPMLILICGPYTSGTGGDPAKIARNRDRLESYALPIYERGHLPMIGEWLALP